MNVLALALVTLPLDWAGRPQNIGLTLFAIGFYLLNKVYEEPDTKLRWLLPVVSVLWANLHGGALPILFAFNLLFLVLCFAPNINAFDIYNEKGDSKKRFRALFQVFLSDILAGLLNPYGIKLYTAVPAAYIAGSQYNDGEEYGVYTTKKADGTFQMHYVKISDCQQTQGGVNWNHGTADEAKVSDDTKAEGTDTATNEDPTMSTQFYIYLDNDTEIPPETPPTEEEHKGVSTDDGRVEYDITVATVNHVNMNHQLSQDFIIGDGDTQCNFGKAFAVGDSKTDNSKREGLAIKVSELQAEPATWRVVPMSNSALKRGEIAMSIAPASAMYNASAIDLSTCSAPLDITENGWFIAGAEKAKVAQDGAGTDAVKHDDAPALPLITTAKIAGSNVNDAGCTPVVRVTYSISRN